MEIPAWWKLYVEFLSLKQYDLECKQMINSKDEQDTINANINNNTNGLSNIFGNIFERKRIENEKQINEQLKEVNKSLADEGKKIRNEYEQLAEELSKFVQFKTEFFKQGIVKVWGKFNLDLVN